MSDGVVTLRERVRERLIDLAGEEVFVDECGSPGGFRNLADAILREFAIRPVAWGKVGEDGEVEGL